MPGPQIIPFLPAYIPQDVDINAVQAEVKSDGVSAPAAVEPGLLQVVADAHREGIDLKIVVVDHSPPIDTPLRDIATVVGAANPDATVLVLSPTAAGSYSPTYDRATLEAGEDLAKTGNPVQSAENFVSQLHTGVFPYTAFTIVLTLAVFLAIGVTRFLQVKGKQSHQSVEIAPTSDN
ncbi:Rv1476 family membrane protein [Mycolicibacterium komossense]|uniref:Membrane transport protein MMPL domain-containing protein n=1 Tax=Mycolicibacterium komossense TaxID=1779 RepID=A0ABT3CBR9_9MYCO|nr:DUF6676 family protein [Mycolicibacterium komossense]MCV7226833.1 hypothetical protein [Mycolicibacterium komossense]